MYHPALGRFINRDPIDDDVNPYGYVGSNPVSATDPTGEKQASEASESAKELENIIEFKLDALKEIAKKTGKIERFGVIAKSKDPKDKQPYVFRECVSKSSLEKVKGLEGKMEPRGATESPFL